MKTIKNTISFGILALLVLGANSAQAYVPGVWDPQPRLANNEPAFYKVPATYDAPVVTQTSTTTVVNNQNITTNKTVATNTTVKKNTTTSNITTPAKVKELPPVVTNGNELTALSLAGSGGFMPSSIWQWLLLTLLILAIIIIVRILSRKPEHTEIHTVTAH